MPTQETTPIGSSNERALPVNTSKISARRLPIFIQENVELIVGEWEVFARTLTPSSTGMTPLALRDHIHQILEFVVADIGSSQTPREQTNKSLGKKERGPGNTAAETHAGLRLAGGFDIEQMVSEYRALRASVIKLWSRTCPAMDTDDICDLTRFNESIDQALAESVSFYTREILHSKDLFVGILTHDLRSPLQAIMLSSELIPRMGQLNDRQTMLIKGTYEAGSRINQLIDNLLDVTRARFGVGLPINRSSMDMGFVGNQVIDEVRVVHPDRDIILNTSGDLKGNWDKARIGQNNKGVPISPEKTKTIFNPLSRATNDEGNPESVNLGLGLFITEEIVAAHAGTISVSSSEQDGTTFSIRLPRSKPVPTLHVA